MAPDRVVISSQSRLTAQPRVTRKHLPVLRPWHQKCAAAAPCSALPLGELADRGGGVNPQRHLETLRNRPQLSLLTEHIPALKVRPLSPGLLLLASEGLAICQ